MSFIFRSLALIGLLISANVWSLSPQLFFGFNKPLNKVQDKKGKEAKNPFSPVLGVGTNFQLSGNFGFSPQLGYIHNTVTSDDSYGKYKVHTLFILYDFIWVPEDLKYLAVRFGIGNFMKTIKGEGGSVQIPNGSGTATAYRPSGSETSYTGTFNLGLDWNLRWNTDWFDNFGIRFETFIFRPLSKENRNYAFNLGTIFYF